MTTDDAVGGVKELALHNRQNAANDLLIEPIIGNNDQILGTSVRLKIRML